MRIDSAKLSLAETLRSSTGPDGEEETSVTEPLVVAGRDWANDADIDSPEYNADFEEVTSSLAAKCPVARSEVGRGTGSRAAMRP